MITRFAKWFEEHRKQIVRGAVCAFTPFLYVACFPPYEVSEAAFIFLVPFVVWLNFGPGLRSVFITTFALAWISWIVLIYWLHHVTWVGMILLSGIVALHFAVWAVGTAWLARRARGPGLWTGVPLAIGAAALWVVLEHIRTHIFTGFPWLPLSASQVTEPIMLQSASIFGSWVVSFALVLLNFGIAAYLLRLVEYARTKNRSICPEFYLALSFLVAISFLLLRLSSGQKREPAFSAAVIQPLIPQDQKWDLAFERKILSDLETLTLRLKGTVDQPDVAFWPETVLPYPLNDDGVMEAWGTRLATSFEAPIIAGAMATEKEGESLEWFNSVFQIRPEYGLFPLYYSKQHLVPFGEYIPLRRFWPWMEKVVPINGDIFPGLKSQLLPLNLETTTVQIGPLICFEDVFPSLARHQVSTGAGVLFVATNSAWYGRSSAAAQHKAHSVLRAIETRRPVIRVGNDGWTGWIDEYGSIRGQLDPWEQSGTVFSISRDRRWVGRMTFYVTYGDWFVWTCWALFGLCVWVAPKLMEEQR